MASPHVVYTVNAKSLKEATKAFDVYYQKEAFNLEELKQDRDYLYTRVNPDLVVDHNSKKFHTLYL